MRICARSVSNRCGQEHGVDLSTPQGRFFNPGHSIEVAWFLLHMCEVVPDDALSELALNVLEGDFAYLDVRQGRVEAKQRLRCELTFLEGELKWDWNGRTGTDWRELPESYGIRNPEGLIMPPAEGGESK